MHASRFLSAAALVALVLAPGATRGLQAQAPAAAPPSTMQVTPEVEKRVESLLAKLTIEEKIDLIGGVDRFFIRAIPKIGLPKVKMADGPFGVRNYGPSTAVAAGIALAATWNPALAEQVGVELGRDSRARGVHYLLAPGVNIYRAPMNGRNFEYLGEDPLLAGRMATGYIKGIQSQGVAATVKHFLGNNSEFDRHNTNSIIDERALREIYLPAFEAAVKDAHVGALMTSYNVVEGVHMSQYGKFNTDLLRKEWGFDGVVMSDWVSVYDAIGAANGGLDLEMPSGLYMNQKSLLPAIKDGKVSVATIDEKVRRILRVAVHFGWLDREQTDLSVPMLNPAGTAVALETAREGAVLLKNAGGVLPIDRKAVKTVAVIGPAAYPAIWVGGGSAGVVPFGAVSNLEGIAKALGPDVKVLYHRGLPTLGDLADRTDFKTAPTGGTVGVKVEFYRNRTLDGTPEATRTDTRINFTGGLVQAMVGPSQFEDSGGRWTGYYTPTKAGNHLLFVQAVGGAGGMRVKVDDKTVLDEWDVSKSIEAHVAVPLAAGPHKIVLEQYRRRVTSLNGGRIRLGISHEDDLVDADAKALAAKADIVLASVGFDAETESEGADRTFSLPVGQDVLIKALAAANRKTVVTITAGGGVEMASWIDSVPAVVMAWIAGEQHGTALGQLLTGEANFSGRLPATFEKRWEENPNVEGYYPEKGTTRVQYLNGIYVGYRGYEHNKVQPLFPFGFGLSYTEFAYSNLTVTPKTARGAYEVSFDVKNTGARAGADVPQVYVAPGKSSVPRPVKELKGFARVSLNPGETKRVTVELDARSFSYWDVTTHQWKAEAGPYDVLVGPSSATVSLRNTLTLK